MHFHFLFLCHTSDLLDGSLVRPWLLPSQPRTHNCFRHRPNVEVNNSVVGLGLFTSVRVRRQPCPSSLFNTIMSNIMNLTESHLAPLPFAGDFLVPIPDEEQLWGLSPVSPMTGSTWDPSKADSAAFAHSAMERDLKNAQVRNGQPTPPPYDEQQSANHLPVSDFDMTMSMSMDSSASASKRRRVREYTAAAASLSPELDLDDGGPMDSAKRASSSSATVSLLANVVKRRKNIPSSWSSATSTSPRNINLS